MEKSTEELAKILKASKSYDEFMQTEIGELCIKTVPEFVDMMIAKKELKKSDIIKKSNLDRNYAYQIMNGTRDNPSRNKIIMLAFGMELSHEETDAFLRLYRLSPLYPRDSRDAAIIFSLSNGKDLIFANEQLDKYNLELLE